MFEYVNNVSMMSHNIIKSYVKFPRIAVDCTLGNGLDTDFLSSHFKKVYSFDIQKNAIDSYTSKKPENVILIYDSNENIMKYITEPKVDCIVYNLGYLPGDNKVITTTAESTISSLKSALNLIASKGFILICSYLGHEEGKRENLYLEDFLKKINKKTFGVMSHRYINRKEDSPILYIIEKK
ncbi:Putative rRNA methylase [Hathewaya proteolytica DSM 3090]|uniref:Putative rRNA methylase n=1 Tax=Hathewaya proteolytica DSM 3090 TaxID=1121331 RepID=A0A1M6J4A1_9CLOT|nr:class I SAM-dependent methyltransferase [Hathewaya proteolytica]SHJ41487.1 Putative rRNA methylase [Hathewaya proteolytica DSM 3090]